MSNHLVEDNSEFYFEQEDTEFVYCPACESNFIPEEKDPDGVYECPNCKSVVSDQYY